MKKIITLIALVAAIALQSQATIYLVGQAPTGMGWDPSQGIVMTDNGDGTYQYVTAISGTVYFCFADQLTTSSSDWSTFNSQYRYGPSSKDYKVVTNTDVPVGKNGDYSFRFDGDGTEYKIIFNLNNLTIRIEGNTTPEVDPITGKCYILGEMGGNSWAPDLGVEMISTDGNIFTVTTSTTNLSDYSYFSFTTKLADNADDWGSITDYRMGAVSDGDFEVTDDMLNTELALSDFGGSTAFKIAPGEYKLTVNVSEKTLVIEGDMDPINPITGDVFIMGEVNGNSWAANTGVQMATTDQNIYTATITTDGANVGDDGVGYSYFSFTTLLGETSDSWAAIAAYRFGASDNDYILSSDQLGIELSLSDFGTANSYKIPAGTYDLTLNLADRTLIVSPVSGDVKGDVTGDGEVSVADVNAVIDMILAGGYSAAADVNGDGEVTVTDVNVIIDIILNM